MATQSTTTTQPSQTAPGGLVAAQGQAQTRATQARGNTKGWAYKLIKPVAIILIIVVPILYWWRDIQDETPAATQTTSQAAPPASVGADDGVAKKGGEAAKASGPKVTTTEPTWKVRKDKVIPVGVWSEETYVAPGCSLHFTIGDGDKVQYRFGDMVWKDYEQGTSPNATHLRHWVSREGATDRPYTLTCK